MPQQSGYYDTQLNKWVTIKPGETPDSARIRAAGPGSVNGPGQGGGVTQKEIIINGVTFPAGTPAELIAAAEKKPQGALLGPDKAGAASRINNNAFVDAARTAGSDPIKLFEALAKKPPASGYPDRRSPAQTVKDVATGTVGAVGSGMSLAGNVAPLPLPLKILLTGGGGAITAASEGTDPLDAALEQIGYQLAFGGLGKGSVANLRGTAQRIPGVRDVVDASKPLGLTGHLVEGGIPEATNYAGQRTAMGLGGVRSPTGRETRRVANDIIDIRKPIAGSSMTSGGGHLGNVEKSQRRIGVLGDQLAAAEEASTATVAPAMFRGSTAKAKKSVKGSANSVANINKLAQGEEKFVQEQTLHQGLLDEGTKTEHLPSATSLPRRRTPPPGSSGQAQSSGPVTFKPDMTTQTPWEDTNLLDEEIKKMTGRWSGPPKPPPSSGAASSPPVGEPGWAWSDDPTTERLVGKFRFDSPEGGAPLQHHASTVRLNMRSLGDIRRQTGRKAEPIIKARALNQPVDAAQDMEGSLNEAFHERARLLQNDLNPEVQPINKELSQLFGIREATSHMRGASTPGAIGARGGLASGTAGSINRTMGAGPGGQQVQGLLGALATIARPGAISAGGNAAQNVLQLLPAGYNLEQLIEALTGVGQALPFSGATSGVSFRKPK
jgi:hypothetical protein